MLDAGRCEYEIDMACGVFGLMCRDCYPDSKGKTEEMDTHPVTEEKQLSGIWISERLTVAVSKKPYRRGPWETK